ncbi:MAG: hypothetical protein FVQ81_15510 [Candidatus Glassbacteria bacterium]|nr:hypothetical protein [Candidatus Glassbacteria bacterium]
MDPAKLIPYAEVLPAPWWILEFLGMLTLTLHLLFINVVLGGSLILLFRRLSGGAKSPEQNQPDIFARKIPGTLAVAVTFGVAPLLFVQVLYGQFFYSSSVLLAKYWIMVIPAVIIAYYSAYVTSRKLYTTGALATLTLTITCALLLYVAFTFQNNISMMLQPEEWTRYFDNRGGTLLNTDDPVLWPRYLHFITASIAVAGLFSAIVWDFRRKKGVEGAGEKINKGLGIFGVATMIQIVLGFWLLISLPREVMMLYMGQNMLYTTTLFAAIILAIAATMSAVLKRLWPTVILLVLTVVTMIVMRTLLRTGYLEQYFRIEDVAMDPQYGIFSLFLVIFVAGLVILYLMFKWAFGDGEEARQ